MTERSPRKQSPPGHFELKRSGDCYPQTPTSFARKATEPMVTRRSSRTSTESRKALAMPYTVDGHGIRARLRSLANKTLPRALCFDSRKPPRKASEGSNVTLSTLEPVRRVTRSLSNQVLTATASTTPAASRRPSWTTVKECHELMERCSSAEDSGYDTNSRSYTDPSTPLSSCDSSGDHTVADISIATSSGTSTRSNNLPSSSSTSGPSEGTGEDVCRWVGCRQPFLGPNEMLLDHLQTVCIVSSGNRFYSE